MICTWPTPKFLTILDISEQELTRAKNKPYAQ